MNKKSLNITSLTQKHCIMFYPNIWYNVLWIINKTHLPSSCNIWAPQYSVGFRSLICRIQPHSNRLPYTHSLLYDQMTPIYSRCSNLYTGQGVCWVYSIWLLQFRKSNQHHHFAKDLEESSRLDRPPRRHPCISKTKTRAELFEAGLS